MVIRRLEIAGFGCFTGETTVDLDKLTVVTGKNPVETVSVLTALKRLFGSASERKVVPGDFALSPGERIEDQPERRLRIVAELMFPETNINDDTVFSAGLFQHMVAGDDGRLFCRIELSALWSEDFCGRSNVVQQLNWILSDGLTRPVRMYELSRIGLLEFPSDLSGIKACICQIIHRTAACGKLSGELVELMPDFIREEILRIDQSVFPPVVLLENILPFEFCSICELKMFLAQLYKMMLTGELSFDIMPDFMLLIMDHPENGIDPVNLLHLMKNVANSNSQIVAGTFDLQLLHSVPPENIRIMCHGEAVIVEDEKMRKLLHDDPLLYFVQTVILAEEPLLISAEITGDPAVKVVHGKIEQWLEFYKFFAKLRIRILVQLIPGDQEKSDSVINAGICAGLIPDSESGNRELTEVLQSEDGIFFTSGEKDG